MIKLPLQILFKWSLCTLLCLPGLLLPNAAKAQPGYAFSGTSGGGNSFPLASSSSNKVQWIFYPTHFSPTLPAMGQITTIYIKASTAASSTFSNLNIKLGNTTASSMSGTAWQTGLTTVYANSAASLSWAANTWIPVTLQSSFLYTGGNLIVEISQTGFTSGGMSVSQNTTLSGGRQWGTTTGTAPAGSGTGQLLVAFDIAPPNCSGTPTAPVITTAAMNAAAPICGTNTTLTATNPNATFNGINLQWQSASSATGTYTNVAGGSGATTLTYTTAPITSTTWFRLGATCTYSGLTAYSTPYQVLAGAPQPSGITGRSTFCAGDTASYSAPVTPGITYTWALPGGWSGPLSGNTIVATMGASAGNISLTANNSCGSSIAKTLAVSPGTAPTMPTMLLGPSIACPATTQTYSTPAVPGATSYTWTRPGGWVGTSTTNTISITTGPNSGTISVKAGNGCGLSPASSKAVTITTTLASPGAITSSASSGQYCVGQLYTFNINPVPGATSYQWQLPSGWSGTNSGTSIQAFAAAGSGSVSVTANMSCTASPASSLAVTGSVALTPSVTLSTPSAICTGVPTSFVATPANAGANPVFIWKKNGVPVAAAGSSYLFSGLNNGDIISVSMTSSLACRTIDTVHNSLTTSLTQSVTPGISLSSNRISSICSGVDVTFTATSFGGGSAPAYQWYKNGIIVPGVTGTAYTTTSLAQGDTVLVRMSSNAVCATLPVTSSNKVGVSVVQSVTPAVNISATSTAAVKGVPVTFTARQTDGGDLPVFQWLRNNVEIPNASSDNYTSSTLVPGDHIVARLVSNHPCATTNVVYSNDIVMSGPTSVSSIGTGLSNLALYPNPTSGSFSVHADLGVVNVGKPLRIDVLNVLGQSVYHEEVTPDKSNWTFNVQLGSLLTNGTYTLRVHTTDGAQANMPFVLNR